MCIGAYRCKASMSVITKEFGVSDTSVYKWVAKYEENHTIKRHKGSGK